MVDATIHPLTAATLSYLRRLFTYPDVGQVGGDQEGAVAAVGTDL